MEDTKTNEQFIQLLLWYNGRRGALEQIGVVEHDGEDLGFP